MLVVGGAGDHKLISTVYVCEVAVGHGSSLAAASSALTVVLGWHGHFHVVYQASCFFLTIKLSPIIRFSMRFSKMFLLFLMFGVDLRSIFVVF